MERVLLASGTADGIEILSRLIKESGFSRVTHSRSCSDARRLADSSEFGLVIINTPLNDEFGRDFAVWLSERSNSGIILICRSDISDDLSDALSDYGIFVLPKPVNKTAFIQTVKTVSAARSRMLGFQSNTAKLHNKTEEIRLINRAKKCLMQYLKLSEPQAHRYIEKQAMDTRRTRKDVAKHILSIYEN